MNGLHNEGCRMVTVLWLVLNRFNRSIREHRSVKSIMHVTAIKNPPKRDDLLLRGLVSPSLPKPILLPDIALAGNPSVLSRRWVSNYAIQRFSGIKTRINFVICCVRVLWFCISNAHSPPIDQSHRIYCIFSSSIQISSCY